MVITQVIKVMICKISMGIKMMWQLKGDSSEFILLLKVIKVLKKKVDRLSKKIIDVDNVKYANYFSNLIEWEWPMLILYGELICVWFDLVFFI